MARERWRLEVEGDEFRWLIERTMLRDCRMVGDRFPAVALRTMAQVPGFLDVEMLLDGNRAFPLKSPEGEWFEVVSPKLVQEIQFAPSGLALESRLSGGFFSFAKPASDGTVAVLSVGGESVDRRRGVAPVRAGTVQRQSWRLKVKAGRGAGRFDLTLADAWLTGEARSFASVHNQWMGWMQGNNPASVPILHEMAWYPMIQGIYARSEEAEAALEKQLLFFAASGVEESGYVFPRWSMGGYYKVAWGNLHDQIPHFILAMYHHAVNTGNREFLRRVMGALERVAGYMLALDVDGDGVAEIPGTSGLPNGERDCSNWYDIIKFGHKDAYVNVYCCAALAAMAEMKAWLGDEAGAARYREADGRARAGFNRVFWDERTGVYMDWIDVRGQGRRYFYTDHNLLAIIFGVADGAQAARILGNLDRRYSELCREFGVPREAIYATPCNMNPVTQAGDLVQFGVLGNQKTFPNYENGCLFFHTTGFEIAARAVAGQQEQAYATFERVMRHGYARNRLWAAALKWDTGKLVSEPLNNALLILWGFLRGCFGVWPGLNGVRVAGKPPGALEGASYRFCHLGRDVRVGVRGGETRVEEAL
ncbi:MAG: hypothetical protein HY858_03985 [Candidatus Solibacter usitatus]|nr:hypothetical protein [Candidatus Solibacter usitatus]